jgi:cation diffusion facilitator family transporter
VDSINDVISTGLVFIGIKKSQKGPDENHPFGHERIDNATSIVLASLFLLTGSFIIYNSIITIVESSNGTIDLKAPTRLAWIVTLSAITIKLGLYFYTLVTAKKSKSTSLKSLATDHIFDVIAMGITLIGVVIAVELDIPLLDPIIAIVTGLLLIYNGVKTTIESINCMVDHSASKDVIKQINDILNSYEGVKRVDNLRTRLFANRIYVEVDISVDETLSVKEGHQIATDIHDEIESTIEEVKHVMVHVNPYEIK